MGGAAPGGQQGAEHGSPLNEPYMRRSGVWEELLLVDSRVQNVSVENEGLSLSFANICAKWNGECK